jgi:hypothetical protein
MTMTGNTNSDGSPELESQIKPAKSKLSTRFWAHFALNMLITPGLLIALIHLMTNQMIIIDWANLAMGPFVIFVNTWVCIEEYKKP